mmetsp:Transcript_48982/g.104170  ORF Transcript_48982/g.104170 Transcript_48982/m.104170 type:complete len:263 (-) Transcript_48982:1683-2471(-)
MHHRFLSLSLFLQSRSSSRHGALTACVNPFWYLNRTALDISSPLPVLVSLTFFVPPADRSAIVRPTCAARRPALACLALAARNPKKFLAAEELLPEAAFVGGVLAAGAAAGFSAVLGATTFAFGVFLSPAAAADASASRRAARASPSRSLIAATAAPCASSSLSCDGTSLLRTPPPSSPFPPSSNRTSLSISGSSRTTSSRAPPSRSTPTAALSLTYVSPSARSVATRAPNASLSSSVMTSTLDAGLDSERLPSPADRSHSP